MALPISHPSALFSPIFDLMRPNVSSSTIICLCSNPLLKLDESVALILTNLGLHLVRISAHLAICRAISVQITVTVILQHLNRCEN